jgi:hypothetical protein
MLVVSTPPKSTSSPSHATSGAGIAQTLGESPG